MKAHLRLDERLPHFAEIPYALWGEVNYDSDGDCKRPTDRDWTELYVSNRVTKEFVSIVATHSIFEVSASSDNLVSNTTQFLLSRCKGAVVDGPTTHEVSFVEEAIARTERIRSEFTRPELCLFDSHDFWGSWKWVGWFATEFAWVGRWIMNAVLTKDPRAVFLCTTWLKEGSTPKQERALKFALELLTGRSYKSAGDWVTWYFESALPKAGILEYPEPDYDSWLKDLQNQKANGV